MELTEIQEKARCNWCLNPMSMSEPISESNFVDTGKTWNGKTAYALYCSSCLASEQRVKQPKSAINQETLAEINVEDLLEQKKEEEEEAQTPEG